MSEPVLSKLAFRTCLISYILLTQPCQNAAFCSLVAVVQLPRRLLHGDSSLRKPRLNRNTGRWFIDSGAFQVTQFAGWANWLRAVQCLVRIIAIPMDGLT